MRKLGFVFLLCLAVVCFGRGPNSVDGGVFTWWSIADSIWADEIHTGREGFVGCPDEFAP